jgi:hypothetical protein
MSFLEIDRPDFEKAFLYEVISTVLVLGQDHRTWEAYGFFDTYQGDSDDRDLRCHARNADLPEDIVKPDLIPLGNRVDCNAPLWDLRAYFLMVWQSHMRDGQVRSWRDLVDRLETAVETYVSITVSDLLCDPKHLMLCLHSG